MILHVDMDAFYASIETRDRPELEGKPVLVGGNPRGRGVVAAANYAARAFGIHSAMPTGKAHQLCPEAVFLAPRIGYYAEVSEQIQKIFKRYTPLVEPLSLDEAFLDVNGSEVLFGEAVSIGRQIKQAIQGELGLCASVGIAPNKFVSKIASDLGKPDGFLVVRPNEVQSFLDPLPVRRLWGIGKVGSQVLEKKGIRSIYDLRQQPLALIHQLFGKWGDRLWAFAQGQDDRKVVPDHQIKSVSNEQTFDKDLEDVAMLRAHLVKLTEQVAWRLRQHGLLAQVVEMKIRFSNFKTITRSQSLSKATQTTQDLLNVILNLFHLNFSKKPRAVRLLGMGASRLVRNHTVQEDLFFDASRKKQQQIDAAVDLIRSKYGASALGRGGCEYP